MHDHVHTETHDEQMYLIRFIRGVRGILQELEHETDHLKKKDHVPLNPCDRSWGHASQSLPHNVQFPYERSGQTLAQSIAN